MVHEGHWWSHSGIPLSPYDGSVLVELNRESRQLMSMNRIIGISKPCLAFFWVRAKYSQLQEARGPGNKRDMILARFCIFLIPKKTHLCIGERP